MLPQVYTDNYRLCCRGVLPDSTNPANCLSPRHELSTCSSLLPSNFHRLFVYVFAALAMTGNIVALFYRACLNNRDSTQTASVFVSSLCVSNWLTGLYLVMVSAADWTYRGNYVMREYDWRHGSVCKVRDGGSGCCCCLLVA